MGWLIWLYQLLCFFFLLYSQLSCSSPVLSSSNSTSAKLCSHDESLALLQFKKSFTITGHDYSDYLIPKNITSWKEATDCCVWDGVTCDGLTGHVIGLDLSWSRLHGTIHSNSTLFQLHHLQRLNLAGNDFDCSQIPSEFGRLSKLTHLNLFYSNFSGSVPQSLGNLTQITHLNLSSNNLNGQFPFSVANFSLLVSLRLSNNKLTFPTASHISGLPKLAYLDLYWNSVNGRLPTWLFTLPSLQYLDLSFSDLVGPIPNQASGLQNLTYLDLSVNSLNGTIPSWLFTLPSLEFVYLNDNHLIGPIPNGASGLQNLTDLYLARNLLNGTLPSWLFALPSLEYLDLSDNMFTGHIDEFQYNSLGIVDLSRNNLQGFIPKSIFKLVNLGYLYLPSNNLSGIVELRMFSKLENLKVLDLSYNSLSCNADNNNASFKFPNINELRLSSCEMSEFPRFLRNQKYLQELDLSNNKIHGHIPEWLGNMSFQKLNLSYNFLTSFVQLPRMDSLPRMASLPWPGSPPVRVCNFYDRCLLTPPFLDLRFNLLQGPLPIPQRNTTNFFISNNKLDGEVPSLICNVSSLDILDLSNNNLSGVIPQCLGSAGLSVLDLRMNRFRGPIPTNFAEDNQLRNLNLNGNQLEGLVPRSLVNCRQLEVLDLGNNNITDTFPHWLETLPDLQILVLRSNKFHGPIISTSNEKFPFPKLRIIDLSHNEFTGLLPKRYLEGLRAMMNIDKEKMELRYMGGRYYADSVTVTIKGQEIELVRVLTIFTTLDFSCNKFEGDIPSVIGKLNSLRLLNISHNNLTGQVPSVLGSLKNLESLDLSSNQLLGKIPWQLTDLTFLAVLNLSNNHLEGPIPRSTQFDTFQSDSYNGNLALCGFPLPNRCGNGEAPQQSPSSLSQQENDSDFLSGFSWGITMMGYGCGLVFGLSMGYIMFSTGKPKWFVRIIEEKCCQKVKKLKKSNQRRAGRGNILFIGK
ncbi:hypothetical protein F0562_026960 [Nyssa sinensis]|uniref:Uncharacterized protein n=1 Tax=Nyssa sinensis TaxID=561372 RepID=A0A5J5B253_9ASTE|nr:hypothetical protein F0562_026960 [Nyssa sinensis]